MRFLMLAAGAAFALTACGNNDRSDNMQNVDETLTADSIVANDVTAIDAVTGDAANMAADVDINFTNDMLEPGGNRASTPEARNAKPSPKSSSPSRAPAPRPASEQPAANAAVNESD